MNKIYYESKGNLKIIKILLKIRNVERNNGIYFALYFYKKHVYDNKSFDYS